MMARERAGRTLPVTSEAAHVTRRERAGAAVVAAVGEFDLAMSTELRDELEAAVRELSPHLVIDLSRTLFLDSSGIGALMSAAKLARTSGGWVRLVAPQPNVRRVLELTQIDTVLDLYDDVDAAVDGVPSANGT
jgi:anti-sigma B factor antagonist